MKVFMGTHFVDGIKRVVDALRAGLPAHGIEVVDEPAQADLLAVHGADRVPPGEQPLVAHVHGLMWDDCDWEYPGQAQEVNARIIHAMARADAITAPSRWVAHAITRGMLRRPIPIYHGVDADAWAYSGGNGGYVLWNKARADAVSDPRPVARLAALLPDVPFVTTIGRPAANVQVVGPQPYDKMRPLVQQAGVYLATTRETFGVGTLEALASGVPVVGYRFGGQEEIIAHGETGYLVEPGDDEALAEAILRALSDRKRLSANAVADVRARWQWSDKIAQYAALYRHVAAARLIDKMRPAVSVIITCYNLGRYLQDAINSVTTQDGCKWELLIVDDGSSDDTETIATEAAQHNTRQVRYLRTPENLGLSGARNYGAAQAHGRSLLFLDADDMLAPGALAQLTDALDRDPDLHIAYGHLAMVDEDGTNERRGHWPEAFDWRRQMAHLNQLTYCALMRRAVWEESGGYRTRDWRAEDAAFWCRVTSLGFRAAKVTDATTLIYRLRPDSKSQQERRAYADMDGPWTESLPWATAHSGEAGLSRARRGQLEPPLRLVPFGAQGEPPQGRRAWPVWHQQAPLVSVVIPCGPGHEQYLLDALDSLAAQTEPRWEAIVVNDTGDAWLAVAGAPYARVLATEGRAGPGAARNLGLSHARAPLTLWLDADDWLHPDALRLLLERYAKGDAGYVYSDWIAHASRHEERDEESGDYHPDLLFERFLHPVTVLMATEHAAHVQFDASIQGWEDWDFFLRAATQGICGARVPLPLLTYRLHSGTMRERSQAQAEAIKEELRARYGAFVTGGKTMPGCCGGGGSAVLAAKQAMTEVLGMSDETNEQTEPQAGNVLMEYIGENEAPVTFFGGDGRSYSGGRMHLHRFAEVVQADVERLENTQRWKVFKAPKAAVKRAAETDIAAEEEDEAPKRGRKR